MDLQHELIGLQRRSRKRHKHRSRYQSHSARWSWRSNTLLIQQFAWLGGHEHDKYMPSSHYNLHIQPLCGGLDYHNYHIRYRGDYQAAYTWSIVDAPYGLERSAREYSLSNALSIRDVVDILGGVAASDITNDVGDITLWLPLIESLPPIFLDLHRVTSFMHQPRQRRRKR